MEQLSIKDLIEHELAKEEIDLPIPNIMASQLGTLLGNEDVDIEKLSKIIERDPSLTAKILNLSNSVFYSGLMKVKTVDRSIARVGLISIKNFLLTSVMKEVFNGEGQYFREKFIMNWKHSLGCAICSKRIAEQINLKSISEDAYILGLLHDIGTIFIFNTLNHVKMKKESFDFSEGLIQEIIETFHPTIGAKVLKKLNFDEKYCRIVATHHDPVAASDDGDDPLFNILQVANNLMRKIGISITPDQNISIISIPATAKLGIDPLFIAMLEVDIEDTLHTMDSML
jgi:putative nucleotidyltransferase with HDIG domain